ncbi:hypothetical protein Fmac_000878 [Flemingia macrophylla]|uniref:Pentatricopeptide repeat-containing protein n=1 Tax=Flemingia macrophylla TaxID=520843 RepID=A0ABD1NH39_9FABA
MPDKFTLPFVIKSCTGLLWARLRQQVHMHFNTGACERLGQIKNARKVFDEMYCRTIVSWTAMINGYAKTGCYVDALEILCEMQVAGIEPDEISVISVLPACAQIWSLEVGKWIHNSQVLGDKMVFEEDQRV